MTKEDKKLLLKDLCGRMPYEVICQFIWTYSNETTPPEGAIAKHDDNIRSINIHTKEVQADYYDEWVDLEHCKPYLRPMSSMTEKEGEEVEGLNMNPFSGSVTDWLNAHHFDYRTDDEGKTMIEKGFALEAPEGMYNTK